MTTNEYIRHVKSGQWPPFERRLWHRNYHDHIICTDDDLERIRAYIADNPTNWDADEYNSHRNYGTQGVFE